jgi:hypothetical protein
MCRLCEEITAKNLAEIEKEKLVIKRNNTDLKKLTKGIKLKVKHK